MPFPQPELSGTEKSETPFRSIFQHAPVPVARCDPHGVIVEMNPAFERSVTRGAANRRIYELVSPQDQKKTESLLCDLMSAKRESIGLVADAGNGYPSTRWTAWRQPGDAGEPDHALLIATPPSPGPQALDPRLDDELIQTQRWEAIGRLAGGVVHDFNNLLTGVMLYCDLLLSSLDARDRRRRYADEIRSAMVQSAALVRQLLVFARPQVAPPGSLSLNHIAEAMQDLLTRLIGENISLDLQLDAELGLVEIDRAQVQQVLLNLVLNARDALPAGGRITVETRNCKFQPVVGSHATLSSSVFPCVLLAVTDNGQGMDANTRRQIFEPFFTTKNSGQGTGLGLTTVRSIVTAHRGLIHFESELGHGTRVMILFPRASQAANSEDSSDLDSAPLSSIPLQEVEKESLS